MLNELLLRNFVCPVCGKRIEFFTRGYWCPFCGTSLNDDEVTEPPVRLTMRDEDGIPVYIGTKSFKPQTYAPFLSQSAMIEILERLCKWEEGSYSSPIEYEDIDDTE